MSSSGVKVVDEVKEVFSKIHIKSKSSEKLKYAVFTFSDDVKQIVVERKGKHEDPESDYETIVSTLPPNDVRYVAYDFPFISNDGAETSKILFISWHPQSSPIKKKMLAASSLNALKTALGIGKNLIEADTLSEVDSKAALEKLGGKALP